LINVIHVVQCNTYTHNRGYRMATELKTFRFDVDVLQRTRDICKRRGDLSYHINEALRQYIDKHGEADLVSEKKPVAKPNKAAAVFTNYIDADRAIDYLNSKADTQYRYGNSNRKLINARLKDYDIREICGVIKKKCDEWKGTEMARYLRPSTLFNATKFEEYLNQDLSNKPKQLIQHESTRTRDQVISNQLSNTDWAD
jgi:uncharacterized phage protein (TIGR02220 family)